MSHYLSNSKDISLMQKCLFSYNLAQKHLKVPFADLYFNKASVHLYMQDYLESIQFFKKANQIDSSLNADQKSLEASAILHRIKKDYFENFLSKSAQKNLRRDLLIYQKARGAVMEKGITKFKTQSGASNKKWKSTLLSNLESGKNPGVYIIGKLVRAIDFKNSPAKMFLLWGPPNDFAILAVFNCSDSIFSQIVLKKSTVVVIDPRMKWIKTGEEQKIQENDQSQLRCLQLFDANNLIIDNMKIN